MALDRKVYGALEDIVGPENISEEPAILDTYSFYNFVGAPAPPERFSPRPEAVLLPGSTEEVQAIVKACNRYRIRHKAFSTGWLNSAAVTTEGVVLLDLRRMDRILELNERDMYAVVEPYVTWAQLQAEAMKRGLNHNIIEAGSQTSVLASHTSMAGMGSGSISKGYNERNVLGVEWVLPTGEILRLGSPGSGAGWFCGDGPGPSLRGIMRGAVGTMGGLGVFTKVGVKLYHWPGPRGFFPLEGRSPVYEADVPSTFKLYYVYFPTWEDFVDAGYKLGEAEIVSEEQKVGASLAGTFMATSNEEYRRMYPILSALVRDWHGLEIVLEADSERELEYKDKVVDKILEETHGRKLALVEHPDAQARVISMTIRSSTPSRAVYRPTGAFYSILSAIETNDIAGAWASAGAEAKKKYVDAGQLMEDGYENAWGIIYEHCHFSHLEELGLYDPADPESCEGAGYIMDMLMGLSPKLGIWGFASDEIHPIAGPMLMNYPHWLKKIKKAFDPNIASDPTTYITPEE